MTAEPPAEPATATRLIDLGALLRRRRLLFVLLLIACLDGVFAGLLLRPARYVSTVTVTVAPPPPQEPDYRYVPAFEVAREARDIFLSQAAAEQAAASAGRSAGAMRSAVTAIAGDGWQTIELRYTADGADEARATATAGVSAGTSLAGAALPEGSTLKVVGTASEGTRVPISRLLIMAGVGVSVLLALLGTVLVDMWRTRR